LVTPVRKSELIKTSGQVVPRVCTLDGFAREIDRQGGVDLGDLESLTCLRIQTRNTEYKITVLAPADSRILLQGGRFAPTPIEAELAGSSFGGHFLKVKWIGVNGYWEVSGMAAGEGEEMPARKGLYTDILVQEGDQWLITSLRSWFPVKAPGTT